MQKKLNEEKRNRLIVKESLITRDQRRFLKLLNSFFRVTDFA